MGSQSSEAGLLTTQDWLAPNVWTPSSALPARTVAYPVFFSCEGEYSEFFNSAPYPFDLDGERWPSVEHYFQAQKAVGDGEWGRRIRMAATPREAFHLGRTVPLPINWRTTREEVMRRALYSKFSQHRDLADLLLSTGDREIVEYNPKDAFWAAGPDGRGLNRLGRLLAQVRAQLRQRCAALEDEDGIFSVSVADQAARVKLVDQFRLLPLDAFSRLRHFQPQTGCLNSCAFCSQSAGVAIWQLEEFSLRNVISALKLAALEKAQQYITPDGRPYLAGRSLLTSDGVFGRDFVMPEFGLLGYERLNHRPGVLFCYLDNDISCYPHLDSFLQFCAVDLGVRVRISTVGYSRHNRDLCAMHTRIAGELSHAIAGIRFSFTPYTAGWRPAAGRSSTLSREEFEQDFANAVRTYAPTIRQLGEGKRTAAVELRFAPHLVIGGLRHMQSGHDHLLVCGPYVVRSPIDLQDLDISVAGTDQLDHLSIDKPGVGVDVIRDSSIAAALCASAPPGICDWQTSRRATLFRFRNEDGEYYSLDPVMGSEGLFAKHFYPKTESRPQSGYIDGERYFMNAIASVKRSYGVSRSEPFPQATWENADEVLARISFESARLTESDHEASLHIKDEVLPLVLSYLTSLKTAGIAPALFFDSRFTIDTGTICNLGRAFYLFRGLASHENRAVTSSHEKAYGTRSALSLEGSVWRISVSPSAGESTFTEIEIGSRNTLAPRASLAVEELHLQSTATATGQLKSRVFIPVDGIEQVNRSAIKTSYIIPGQRVHE